jgi:hypothetical protein
MTLRIAILIFICTASVSFGSARADDAEGQARANCLEIQGNACRIDKNVCLGGAPDSSRIARCNADYDRCVDRARNGICAASHPTVVFRGPTQSGNSSGPVGGTPHQAGPRILPDDTTVASYDGYNTSGNLLPLYVRSACQYKFTLWVRTDLSSDPERNESRRFNKGDWFLDSRGRNVYATNRIAFFARFDNGAGSVAFRSDTQESNDNFADGYKWLITTLAFGGDKYTLTVYC